jgi:hypothetical protein
LTPSVKLLMAHFNFCTIRNAWFEFNILALTPSVKWTYHSSSTIEGGIFIREHEVPYKMDQDFPSSFSFLPRLATTFLFMRSSGQMTRRSLLYFKFVMVLNWQSSIRIFTKFDNMKKKENYKDLKHPFML